MIFFEDEPINTDNNDSENTVHISYEAITDEKGTYYYVKEYYTEDELKEIDEHEKTQMENTKAIIESLSNIEKNTKTNNAAELAKSSADTEAELLIKITNMNNYLVFFFFLYFFNWCWSSLRSWRKNSGVK